MNKGLPVIPFVPPPIDLDRLYAEDQLLDTINGILWRFGKNISVNLNPGNSSTWHTSDLTQHELSLEGQLPGIYIIRVVNGQDVNMARIIKR